MSEEPGGDLPLQAVEGLVAVEYATLMLVGDGYDYTGVPQPDDETITAGSKVVLAHSAWGSHEVLVRLEFWSREPARLPVDPGGWEVSSEVVMPFDEPGDLVAFTMTGGPTSDVRLLLPAAGAYQVRMYCRGRERAVRVQLQLQDEYDPTMTPGQVAELEGRGRGIEQYLFQVWPAET